MENVEKINRTKQNWISFQTIFNKEITRINRIWTQTLLPSIITSALYFVVFGSLIGSRVGEVGGVDYMSFIVPGLIMMAVITNSFTNVAGSFFGNKFQKSIEELLVSPTPNWIIVLGVISGGIYRGLLVGFFVTLVSMFFTSLSVFNIFILITSVVLTSALFSLFGLVVGIKATKFDDIGIIPLFVLTPLTYFGGVFFSIDMLPTFWQNLSLINPILYMVNLFRYGFLGTTDVSIYLSYGIILATICLFYGWSIKLLKTSNGMRA
jgi:ABC-2 type transport system permease protein